MSKLIGIATGDFHLNNWKQFNPKGKRLKQNLDMVRDFIILSNDRKVPIWFTGDFLHTPDFISNKLLDAITETLQGLFEKYPNAKMYAITGNHDQSESNTLTTPSPSYIKSLSRVIPNIICIDYKSVLTKGVMLHGIPYLDHNRGFEEAIKNNWLEPGLKHILMIHTNLYGATDPSGYEVSSVENIPRNMGKFFKDFDMVLSGHIHKTKELWPNKVYMVGSPCQQRKSDMGCKMCYLEIYEDLKVKTVETNYPEFRYYDGDKPPDDFNYWMPKPKKKENKIEVIKTFNNTLSRRDIVDSYFDVKGIDSNIKKKFLMDLLNSVE